MIQSLVQPHNTHTKFLITHDCACIWLTLLARKHVYLLLCTCNLHYIKLAGQPVKIGVGRDETLFHFVRP